MNSAIVGDKVRTQKPGIVQKNGAIPSCHKDRIAILRMDQISVGEVVGVE